MLQVTFNDFDLKPRVILTQGLKGISVYPHYFKRVGKRWGLRRKCVTNSVVSQK